MPNSTSFQGEVIALAPDKRAFKIRFGDEIKWVQISARRKTTGLPEKGTVVSFDAYGPERTVVYKWDAINNPDALPVKPASETPPAPSTANVIAATAPTPSSLEVRRTALLAAATAMQGQPADGRTTKVIAMAKAFEAYLRS